MVSRYAHKGFTWIDLESPTPGEVRQIMEEFDFHPMIAEDLLSPSLKPKVDRYPDALYLILHFPPFSSAKSVANYHEVDFVLGRNYIITTRYAPLDPFVKLAKVFEANSILDHKAPHSDPGYMFCFMLSNLYRSLEGELETLSMLLDRIEDNIFEGKEKEMVYELSRTSRRLLNFKQSLFPHQQILESLESMGGKMYGTDFTYQIRSTMGDYYRVQAATVSEREMLEELRQTNNALLSTKENEIMKTLTIMAFTTFPLTLFSSLFAIETKSRPIVGIPGDFWILLGIMFSLMMLFFVFFKRKKWL